jgi:HK97 family phage portal protein
MTSPYFSIDSNQVAICPVPAAAAKLGTPQHISNPNVLEVLAVQPPAAGIRISERNALTLSAVWCAVNLKANTIAQLPLHLFRRKDDGSREVATDHPIHKKLIAQRPNPYMSWFVFTRTLQAHLEMWGRAAAEIERNNAGDPIALWPILPDEIMPDIDDAGTPFYWYSGTVPIEAEDIIWLPGLGYDGLSGYSPIAMARESLSGVAAAERYGHNFFGADGRPAGLLRNKKKISPEGREAMRKEWRSLYGGGGNSGRIAILQEDTEFFPLTTPPEDSQFLQTRKFGIVEVARWFNVPPHMLKDLDRATFNNIEEQGFDFLIYSILPVAVLWTQELAYKLLTAEERATHYFEHTFEHILRVRVRDRYAAYNVARQWGWMSVNDIRRRENMPLIGPEGDVYMVPANMMPARNFLPGNRPAKQQAGLLGPDGRSIQEWMRVAV